MWVCVSGVVAVKSGSGYENFGPGYPAGILGAISGVSSKFADVTAESDLVVARFPAKGLQEVMR
eukprot:gene11606-biopygen8448